MLALQKNGEEHARKTKRGTKHNDPKLRNGDRGKKWTGANVGKTANETENRCRCKAGAEWENELIAQTTRGKPSKKQTKENIETLPAKSTSHNTEKINVQFISTISTYDIKNVLLYILCSFFSPSEIIRITIIIV